MADMIRIRNWEKWQSYRRDRGQPPWIKVHRQLMRDPNFVALSDAQRGQLMTLWILAADRDGEIPADPSILRKLCYMDDLPDLQVLEDRGFIERDGNVTPTRRQHDHPEAETEAETEAYKNNGPSADVEKSSDAKPPAVELPTYTEGELLEEANNVLGMKVLDRNDQQANRTILRTWLYKRPPIPSEEVYAAIHGLRWMVDTGRPEVSEWLSPKKPISLKALNNTETLFDQGDGKAKRVLFDVAVELYQRIGEREPGARGKGVSTIAQTMARMGAA